MPRELHTSGWRFSALTKLLISLSCVCTRALQGMGDSLKVGSCPTTKDGVSNSGAMLGPAVVLVHDILCKNGTCSGAPCAGSRESTRLLACMRQAWCTRSTRCCCPRTRTTSETPYCELWRLSFAGCRCRRSCVMNEVATSFGDQTEAV